VKLYFVVVIIFLLFDKSYSQYLPVNFNSNIYDFLDRMEIKGLIQLPTETKPYSLKIVKKAFEELNAKKYLLSNNEKKYLEWFGYLYGSKDLLIPFKYSKDKFYFDFTPIAGYNFEVYNKENGFSRVGGLRISTTYGENFAGYVHLQDKGEFGNFIDRKKTISFDRGYEFQYEKNGMEYSDVSGGIYLDWDWASIGLAKDYNLWGHGNFGNVILSDKVNSFPFIKFEYNPINWLRFKYIFGWLNSKVIDSNYYYNSYPGSLINERRYNFINKFFVANLFTIQPFSSFTFSAGNSFIYSGNSVRLETFIPFAFFKYLDRDVGKGQISDGNGQLFFDGSYRIFNKIRIYGTFFIDVISIRKTLRGNYIENWFAYTLGAKSVDLPIENLVTNIEYTRVDPWVYEHKDITTTYKHLNYTLGHWIGQNADLLSVSFLYFTDFRAKFNLILQWLRKGGAEDIYYAYEGRDEKTIYFLYPPLRKDFWLKFNIDYELYPTLLLSLNYVYSFIKDEDPIRTEKIFLGKNHHIKFGFSFGFPY